MHTEVLLRPAKFPEFIFLKAKYFQNLEAIFFLVGIALL